jgi:hypothetical protein
MGYAKHVGRVGALAVAFGIGAAVATTPGVAWAEGPDDAPPPPPASQPADSGEAPGPMTPSSTRHDPGVLIRRSIERATDDFRKVMTGAVQSSGGAITSTHRNGGTSSGGSGSPVEQKEELEKAQSPKEELEKGQSPKDVQKSTPFVDNHESDRLSSVVPPRWRAPQVELDARPAPGAAAKMVDDAKASVRQTITTVTGKQPQSRATTVDRNAMSTLDLPPTQDVRTPFVAPIQVVTNVLNVALAPFLNTTPGQPAPQNPVLWGVLAWVRRQIQDSPFGKIVLNRTPEITTPKVVDNHDGTFTITPSDQDFDPDEDDLTYSASNGVDGTVVRNDSDGTFTYTVTDPSVWDKFDTIYLTASDEGAYPHIHGLAGLFKPGSGHTASIKVIIEPSAGTAEVIQLPEGYTALGSGSAVGADGKVYRATKYSANGVDAYALVVQKPGGDTEIIELSGEPIGELAFGPGGTLYQNIQTPNAGTGGYDYALTVIAPAPATATFALMASNALDTGDPTISWPGKPVGSMAIGSDGTVYQAVRSPGDTSPPDSPCMDCSVAIVLPGSVTAVSVPLTGQLLSLPARDSNSLVPPDERFVTAGPGGTAYLTTFEYPSGTTTVWRVDASTSTATEFRFTNLGAQYGPTIGADGTAYITTQVNADDGTQTIYDTKMWVIAPDTNTAKSFQLDGNIDSPVAVDGEGVAYVTTSRSDFDGTEPVMIWRVDPTRDTPALIEVDGDSAGSVLVAPDGTAYQLITREADRDVGPDTVQYLMAVIEPTSTSPTVVDLGTFTRSYPQNSTTVTSQGTVYQVLGNFDWDTFTGDATVFIFDGATHKAIPLEGVASTPVAIGAGNTAYVVTATNIDPETLTGDETLWVINPSGTEPLEVPIDTEGTPVSLRVGGDSAFFTTLRIDPDTQTSVYDVVAVTIPSQAV